MCRLEWRADKRLVDWSGAVKRPFRLGSCFAWESFPLAFPRCGGMGRWGGGPFPLPCPFAPFFLAPCPFEQKKLALMFPHGGFASFWAMLIGLGEAQKVPRDRNPCFTLTLPLPLWLWASASLCVGVQVGGICRANATATATPIMGSAGPLTATPKRGRPQLVCAPMGPASNNPPFRKLQGW